MRAFKKLLAEKDLDIDILKSERPLNRGGLLFGYAGVPEESIRDGVKRMAKTLKSYRQAKKF